MELNLETTKLFKARSLNKLMKCANCENHKHYECIDCLNEHKTYLCECDCHDASTKSHKLEKH